MVRDRWASLASLLVCRRTGLVVFKKPPWFGRMRPFRRVMGLLLRESGRRESKALLSGPLGISAICPASEAAEPRGVREPYADAGCHAAPEGKDSFWCEYIEIDAGGMWHRPQCVCRQRGCACGVATAGSRGSLSSNCQKTGESNFFISDGAAHCVQSRRQRFPTVRMVGWVGNGEARAKTANIRACTSTAT